MEIRLNSSHSYILLCLLLGMALLGACSQTHEHVAAAVRDSDSLPAMTSHGISNLISDSGLISYKIVAEDWDIYTAIPPKWTFLKGLFMEKFDTTMHVLWYVQADTAYCHDNRIWELRGRVVILNREGTLFRSEEFFWNMNDHQIWSNMFMRITKPDSDQQLEGNTFRSNEEMTDYLITSSVGFTPMNDNNDNDNDDNVEDPTLLADQDTTASDTLVATPAVNRVEQKRKR